MKKIIISVGLCLCVGFAAMAQVTDDVFSAAYANKRGVYLLPQAGDFAIGIDAAPFLQYVGNFFSSYNSDSPDYGFGNQTTIYGKYFLQDNRAVRARLTLDMYNTSDKGIVPYDAAIADDPSSEATRVDIRRNPSSYVALGVGYELRRGNGRVQGYYGGELFAGFRGDKTKYTWGNRITEDIQNPNLSNFDGTYSPMYYSRNTIVNPGIAIFAGIGAFAGVEYFFAPQLSIGGEFGLGITFSMAGQGEVTSERWNVSNDKVQTRTDKYNNWNDALDLGVFTGSSGRIMLTFHF
jgi:hypothetical protein